MRIRLNRLNPHVLQWEYLILGGSWGFNLGERGLRSASGSGYKPWQLRRTEDHVDKNINLALDRKIREDYGDYGLKNPDSGLARVIFHHNYTGVSVDIVNNKQSMAPNRHYFQR